MISFLLILYLGMTSNGTPQFIVKPFNTEQQCIEYGGHIDVLERLNDNYGIWWECIKRPLSSIE